jgi:hypothetical protein
MRPAGFRPLDLWSGCRSAVNYSVCLRLLMNFWNNMAQVWYTIEQRVCLVQLYFKYEFARKCRRNIQRKFPWEPAASRRNTYYLVNKLKTKGSFTDKEPDRRRTALTGETLVIDMNPQQENHLNFWRRFFQEHQQEGSHNI